MFLLEDDQGRHTAEGVPAVGLHAWHPTDAALPILAPARGWRAQDVADTRGRPLSPTRPPCTPALTSLSTRPSRQRAPE